MFSGVPFSIMMVYSLSSHTLSLTVASNPVGMSKSVMLLISVGFFALAKLAPNNIKLTIIRIIVIFLYITFSPPSIFLFFVILFMFFDVYKLMRRGVGGLWLCFKCKMLILLLYIIITKGCIIIFFKIVGNLVTW